jgi:D-alanyl-D-alanine carboxypeptidase
MNVYMSSEGSSPLPLMKYHADDPVPLASLTKLMTALIALTYNPAWDESVTILAEDRRPGARQRLHPGDTVTVADLWKLLLIASDNDAAAALARSLAGSESAFVNAMNALANSWSLSAVTFADASGLSDGNRASARDFAVIARKAFSEERIVTAASVTDSTVFIGGEAERIFNTDQVLQDNAETATYGWTLTAGKTGHTEEAGYNIALLAGNETGEAALMVLLGGKTATDRAEDVLRLVPWALTTTKNLPTGERHDERLLY